MVETPSARIDTTFSEPDIEVIYNQDHLETVTKRKSKS